MLIKKLELENFKCHKSLTVVFNTEGTLPETNIYGSNGSGKTSIMDAFYYMLFRTDSLGRTNTEMRPYDENGVTIPDLRTSVKGTFEIEGAEHVLEVVRTEKWVRISGSDERTFQGFTHEYFVDGVPKKEKEYNAFIQEFFWEPWFSLTSNPRKFPSLPWAEQRKILIDLAGEVTVDAVLQEHPELAEIKGDLENFSTDDLKKKWTAEKRAYDKIVAETIPRIDELTKTLSGLENSAQQKADAELELLKFRGPLEELQGRRIEIIKGTATDSIKEKIAAVEAKMEVIRGVRREAVTKVKQPYIIAEENIKKDCESKAQQLRILRPQMAEAEKRIENMHKELAALTEEWKSIDSEVFDDAECPCCHRPYIPEMLEPMLAAFNKGKADRLEACDDKGMKLSQKLDTAQSEKAKLLKTINELSSFEVEQAPQLQHENSAAMFAAVDKVPPLEDFIHPASHEKFWELAEGLKLLKRDLENSTLDVTLQLQKVDAQIAEAKKPVEAAQAVLAKLQMDDNTRERIEQLKAEKKNNMLLLGDTERKLALLDKFIVAKIDLISDSVNGLFKRVTFKLFEKNISNKGIRETCELMMNGVPYRQLSNAESVIAGMDVVMAISERLKLSNPVFIDNREGITRLPEVPGQLINLIVSADDKKVRAS